MATARVVDLSLQAVREAIQAAVRIPDYRFAYQLAIEAGIADDICLGCATPWTATSWTAIDEAGRPVNATRGQIGLRVVVATWRLMRPVIDDHEHQISVLFCAACDRDAVAFLTRPRSAP